MGEETLVSLANAPVVGLVALIVILLIIALGVAINTMLKMSREMARMSEMVTTQGNTTITSLTNSVHRQDGQLLEQRAQIASISEKNSLLAQQAVSFETTIKTLLIEKAEWQIERGEFKLALSSVTGELTDVKDRVKLLEAHMRAGGMVVPADDTEKEPAADSALSPEIEDKIANS